MIIQVTLSDYGNGTYGDRRSVHTAARDFNEALRVFLHGQEAVIVNPSRNLLEVSFLEVFRNPGSQAFNISQPTSGTPCQRFKNIIHVMVAQVAGA